MSTTDELKARRLLAPSTMGILGTRGGVTELRTRDLDEAQRHVRDRTYRRAYFMLGIASVTFMLATFANTTGWLPGGVLIALGAIVFNLWLGAPVHLLAWTLPDVEDDSA